MNTRVFGRTQSTLVAVLAAVALFTVGPQFIPTVGALPLSGIPVVASLAPSDAQAGWTHIRTETREAWTEKQRSYVSRAEARVAVMRVFPSDLRVRSAWFAPMIGPPLWWYASYEYVALGKRYMVRYGIAKIKTKEDRWVNRVRRDIHRSD